MSDDKEGTAKAGPDSDASDGALDDAFISPDDPIPARDAFPEDALISPDEPIKRVPKKAKDDASISHDEDFDPDSVVVTGMGDDAHLDPEELAMGGDPHVMELSAVVSKLAADLTHKGEAGLRATPSMGRFEATLRGYCVGYLAGRRADDEPPPVIDS